MIASVGESLIDFINGENFTGGCAFNAAIAASRLGGAVTFFGKVSSDELGHMILEKMIDNGVLFDPQLCNSDKPTLVGRIKTDEKGIATYSFDYKGTATCDISTAELSRSFDNEGDIDIVLFGSISLIMEPGCNAIWPAIKSIKTKPALVLDPNVRPSLIKDGASYRKWILSLASECDIVKVSEEDMDYLFPDIERSEAERRFVSVCKSNLVVTRGAEGSTWFTKAQRYDCPPVKVDKVADTVGCGDTFAAALLVFIEENDLSKKLGSLDGDNIGKALAFASKASAMNCLKDGCNPPFRSEMG